MKIEYSGKPLDFSPENIDKTIGVFDTLIHLIAAFKYPKGCEKAGMEVIDLANVKKWWTDVISSTDEYKEYAKAAQERLNTWCEDKIKDKVDENPRWELHTNNGRTYRKNEETGNWEISEGIEFYD